MFDGMVSFSIKEVRNTTRTAPGPKLQQITMKKISIVWVFVLPVITFLFGTGVFWEWRKSDVEVGRLDIERAKASYEIRSKMTPLLLEIPQLEPMSAERTAKERDFNALELSLARIEGRPPIVYVFPPAPPTNIQAK